MNQLVRCVYNLILDITTTKHHHVNYHELFYRQLINSVLNHDEDTHHKIILNNELLHIDQLVTEDHVMI